MGELSKLPNIGKELERQLGAAGIETVEQFREAGEKTAWLRLKAIDPSACYNRLCALEGALQDIRWHNLSDDIKQELKAFYQAQK